MLPNFMAVTDFVKKKTNLHKWSVERTYESLHATYAEIESYIQKSLESTMRAVKDRKTKLRKLEETAEDLKQDVMSVLKLVETTRVPTVLPKEPVFAEFPPMAYVNNLPTTGPL